MRLGDLAVGFRYSLHPGLLTDNGPDHQYRIDIDIGSLSSGVVISEQNPIPNLLSAEKGELQHLSLRPKVRFLQPRKLYWHPERQIGMLEDAPAGKEIPLNTYHSWSSPDSQPGVQAK